jgi:peptide/nickel transport system substrate-binding protein
MKRNLRGFAAAGSFFLAMFAVEAAFAQKQGGILKMYSPDSPASMSIHEEATVFSEGPMMGVFNNLVMFDQHVPQNSLQSIVPDLEDPEENPRCRRYLCSNLSSAVSD